ncbi:MAG TPA: caspase family protein [Polyangia bacterium]|jgi:hypothetical protein|nr:caspase family protein [Polyangia bacterium]
MRAVWLSLALALLGAAAVAPTPASAAGIATFAVVVGVNRSVDSSAALLRYADDDAARFRDLFHAVGTRTHVLTRMDDNTRRLYPAAAQETPPRLEALKAAVAEVAAEVAQARKRGERTVFYFVYAGHGMAQGQGGYITLEDARLSGPDLIGQIIDPIAADQSHLIVDACNSYFLVLDRGPGGTRRALRGFTALGAIAQRRDVGLLLSTSSARESHEWAAFQAGIFSHEVRSGLYGAADADGDGVISYLEIAAFIDRANESVPNERFRPEVFSRPPDGVSGLLDLRPALARQIEVNGPYRGHYYVEDTAGVRLADFHNAGTVRLVRPSPDKLYLRRKGEDREYVLLPSVAALRTADLPLQESHAAVRGAANDAFNTLFALPFGTDSVQTYGTREEARVRVEELENRAARQTRIRSVAGVGLAVTGVAAVTGGVISYLGTRSLRQAVNADTPQNEVLDTNQKITSRNRTTGLLLGAGAAALGGSALLLLWPESPINLTLSCDGLAAGWRGSF